MFRTPGEWLYKDGLIVCPHGNVTIVIAETMAQDLGGENHLTRGPSSKFEVAANGRFLALAPKMYNLLQQIAYGSKKLKKRGPVLVRRSVYNAVVQFLNDVDREL